MMTTPPGPRALGRTAPAGRAGCRVFGVVGLLLAGLMGCAGAPTPAPRDVAVTVPAPLEDVRQTPPLPAAPPAQAAQAPALAAPPPPTSERPASRAAPEARPAPAEPAAAAEERVLALANDARAAAGLAPLTRDPDLDAVARAWSRHLAAGGLKLAHNPDYAAQIPPGASKWAENVGHRGPSGETADAAASAIHAAWMASPGHRANLLDPALTHIGVGVAMGADGAWYVTQDFAAY